MYVLRRGECYFISFDLTRRKVIFTKNKLEAYQFKNMKDCLIVRNQLSNNVKEVEEQIIIEQID